MQLPWAGFPGASLKTGVDGGTAGCQDPTWWAGVRKAPPNPEGHVVTQGQPPVTLGVIFSCHLLLLRCLGVLRALELVIS